MGRGDGGGPASQMGSVRVGTEQIRRDPTYTGFGWRPRCIDDTVDAGVHPVIAAMRIGQKQTVQASVHVVDGIDLKANPWDKGKKVYENGYTFNRKNGPASGNAGTDPNSQLDRLVGMGVNTQDYMIPRWKIIAGADPQVPKSSQFIGFGPRQTCAALKDYYDHDRLGS